MSKYGITYRGIHSSDVGLIAKVVTKPAAPPVRVIEETVPYRDGSVDYSESGGRLFYDDKIMEIEFKAIGPELSRTEYIVSKAVNWLMGGFGDLILDSAPLTKWIAKPIELSDIATELYRVGSFTVQFRCKPFNQLVFDSLGPELDCDIQLDSDVPIGYGTDDFTCPYFETGFEGLEKIGIKTVVNSGDLNVYPEITITISKDYGILLGPEETADGDVVNYLNYVTITSEAEGVRGEVKVTFISDPPKGGEKLIVDNKNKQVWHVLENGEMNEITNADNTEIEFTEPIVFVSGRTTVKVDSDADGLVHITPYTPQYFYVNRELEAITND